MASEETIAYLKGLADGTRRTPGQEISLAIYQIISDAVRGGKADSNTAFGALLTVIAVIIRQQPQERTHETLGGVMSQITTAVYGDDN